MEKKVIRMDDRLLERFVMETVGRMMLLEAMSPEEVYGKYYSYVPENVFNAAVKSDPTSSPGKVGRYVKWILNLYRNGSWKPGDSDETKETLSLFEKNRQRMSGKDINSYKSVYDLYQDLKPFMDNKSHGDIKREGADKVYEDSYWLIVIPRTEEASKLYGKGTKWCTAAENNNWFERYNSVGPLYININKINGEKYQFHFESESFMDAEDDEIEPMDIGLSDGAMGYYESIGHKKDLLPFDEAVSECMQLIKNGVPIDKVFQNLSPIGNGMVGFSLRGKVNILTRDKKLLWNGWWFDDIGVFHDGYCLIQWDENSWDDNLIGYNYIDVNGKLLLNNDTFQEANAFNGGHANVVDWNGISWTLFTDGRMWYNGNLPRWMGVEGTGWKRGGTNNPGIVYYDGESVNDWDLNDFVWKSYVSECEGNGTEPDDDEFDHQPEDWFRNVLDEYWYAEFGDDSVNESLVRKIVVESLRLLFRDSLDD